MSISLENNMHKERQDAIKVAGSAGESILSDVLKPLVEKGVGLEVRDLLLWKDATKTVGTQIDNVFVTPYAVYCFEVKNYRGTVSGRMDEHNWKHTKPEGQYDFPYNPVKQNWGHVSALRNAMDHYPVSRCIPIINVVVFGDLCELRIVPKDKYVCNVRDVIDMIEGDAAVKTAKLSPEEVKNLFTCIDDQNDKTREGRAEHMRLSRINAERTGLRRRGVTITPEIEEQLKRIVVPTKLEGDIVIKMGANNYASIADLYRGSLRASDGGYIRRHMPPKSIVCPFTGNEYSMGTGEMQTFYNGLFAIYLSQDKDFANELVRKVRAGGYLSTGVPRYDDAVNSYAANPKAFVEDIQSSRWFKNAVKKEASLDSIISGAVAQSAAEAETAKYVVKVAAPAMAR